MSRLSKKYQNTVIKGRWLNRGQKNQQIFQTSLKFFSTTEKSFFLGYLDLGSVHPQLIILIRYCKLNRKLKMSHKSLYDTLFSTLIHKADFIGQSQYYNVVSNEAKKSTYLIGSLNLLLTWRRRENIFKTFMGMKRSGWAMAPRVYTSVQIKQLCKS